MEVSPGWQFTLLLVFKRTRTREEILVSNVVKDLALGPGIRFEDRGAFILKGVPGEWRLYAISE